MLEQANLEMTELYEQKLVNMKQHCEQMYSSYIPKKDDKVDEALASFVARYPEKEKMKILFIRESEGVYHFGQKRIHVKIEKSGQVLIRVGGGYMTAADFIEAYTPQEVAKIERNDVSKRFAEKLHTQRLSRDLSTGSLEKQPIELSQKPLVRRDVSASGGRGGARGKTRQGTLSMSQSRKNI